jgi:hypothetical protein
MTISVNAVTSHLPETVCRLAMLFSDQTIQPADERSALIGFYMAHLGILSDLVGMRPTGQTVLPSGYFAT